VVKREDDTNPQSISEERMLDWIDGALSELEQRQLEKTCDPNLVAAVKRMRADRDAIASIASVRAPADLHDRMMEVFEREALLAPSTDSIPISKLKVNVRGSATRGSPAVPLALAAGLLLMVSGGIYLLLGNQQSDSLNPGARDYAIATPEEIAPMSEESARAIQDSVVSESDATQVATDQARSITPEVRQVDKTPMTEERVLRLAREGRVVMRVVADELDALDRLKSDGAKPRYGREWRLRGDVPMTQSSLKAFRAVLSDRLDAKVVFEELESPVDVPPSLDPAETLWWTRGSSRWIDRVSMPVVIEER